MNNQRLSLFAAAAAAAASFASVAVVSAASLTSDNDSSRLMVHIPHKLFKEEGYDHREALFGIPPYGGSIAQNVYFADSDLCDPNVDTSKGYPQRNDGSPWKSPYILMLDRGNCTFVQKVRNAQRSGAAGVVIADTTCLCSDMQCMTNFNGQCEANEPIMADDGSGSDISIPAFLMFKTDADKIKEELKLNKPVQIEMAWSLPRPDDRVEYDLWSVPADPVSRDFLASFQPVAEALGDRAYFTPHMYIKDGDRMGCRATDGESACYNLCTNKGRYCATDPDGDPNVGISGADVVRESLRRLCIWDHYGAPDGIGSVYWKYVKEFITRCSSADYFSHDDCIADVYKQAGIDSTLITNCMADSGNLDEDTENTFLEVEINMVMMRGVVVSPAAYVNEAVIRGALTVSNVFNAICAGFMEGTVPSICTKCAQCSEPVSCIQSKGVCTAHGGQADTDGVSKHTYFSSLFFVMFIMAGFGYYHYRKTQREMPDQVRSLLAEYMPLEDSTDYGRVPMMS